MSNPIREKEVPFVLRDPNTGREVNVVVKQCQNGMIEFLPEGYSDYNSVDGGGSPAVFEIWEDRLRLIVFADINQEDPTEIIDLENAQESNRESEERFNIFVTPANKNFQPHIWVEGGDMTKSAAEHHATLMRNMKGLGRAPKMYDKVEIIPAAKETING